MNGIEVAVKFPKIKLKLRDKDLKKFAKEVALQVLKPILVDNMTTV